MPTSKFLFVERRFVFVSAFAVQLRTWMHQSSGKLQRLFAVLMRVAAISACAALLFAATRRAAAA